MRSLRVALPHVLLLVGLVLLIGGCTTNYRWTPGRIDGRREQPPQRIQRPTVEQSRWAHLFALGLIGRDRVDLRDVCPGPVAEGLRIGSTLSTTLVSVLTFGIYTPLEYRFSCVVPPPGPLVIPEVMLEETAPLGPDLGDPDFEGPELADPGRRQAPEPEPEIEIPETDQQPPPDVSAEGEVGSDAEGADDQGDEPSEEPPGPAPAPGPKASPGEAPREPSSRRVP